MKPLSVRQRAAIAEILDTLDTRLRDPAAVKRALLWRDDRPDAPAGWVSISPRDFQTFANKSTK